MQVGGFSHAKCFKCGHLAKVESFEIEMIDIGEPKGYMFQAIYKCPLCGDKACEALFANELN